MKKVLKIFSLVMCIVLLVSLASCDGFMSASQVKKVVKEFGTPQAKMTLTFTANNKTVKYVITYDILLDKTPITAINFINLVNSDYYKNAIFENYNSSYNYYLAGRYQYTKNESGSSRGEENVSGITMPGEFKTNKYSEPKGGYEQFSLFSLAMYHEDKADSFDSANGALIFSTASSSAEIKKPLNYTNYAVFARMSSVEIYEGDEQEAQKYTDGKISSVYLDRMTKQTSTTSCSMITASGESKSVTVLGSSSVPRFVFSIEMVENGEDWTKLPKVN